MRRYERSKLDKLAEFPATRRWLSDALRSWLAPPPPDARDGGAPPDARRASLRAGERAAFRAFLAHALSCLLASPVRLDAPNADQAGGPLPETLRFDGGRLAHARDVVDRVVLVSTILVLFRQVLARSQITCAPAALATLCERCGVLLQQRDTRLPSLVAEVERAASASCERAGRGALSEAELASLRSLITNAADPNNSIFALYFKRSREALAELALLSAPADEADVAALVRAKGFASFQAELADVGAGLGRLLSYNLDVSAAVYNTIVQAELARPGT